MVDSLRLVSMLGVTCPLTCAQRRESCVLGTLRAAARAAALARASAALDALLRRLVPQTSAIARCALARLLAVSVFDRPNEFLSCKAYLGMLTIALQSSDEARNFIERTQPRREPPMSMEDPRSERMSKWKDDELDTIRIYEEVGLMFPGTLTNGVNRFAEDVRSVTCPSVAGEFKTCYSTHHEQDLFEQTGATANDLGYIRIDQLRRYREQFGESSHECLRLYLDRRILDISSVEASQDFVSKRCNVPD